MQLPNIHDIISQPADLALNLLILIRG